MSQDLDEQTADLLQTAWERLDAGDAEAALRLAVRAQSAAGDHAEVLMLQGAIAAQRDDVDAALTAMRRAAEADPTHPRPLIYAADLQLNFFDDPEAAIELLDRAIDLAENDDELIDAVILKAEAAIATGERDDEARECLAELEGCAVEDAGLWCEAGDLYMALGDVDHAQHCYEAALDEDEVADAYHGLGMVYDARGAQEAMVGAWRRTRELDLAAAPEAWHLPPAEFEAIAEAALRELPREVLDRLENVPILIEDAPSEALIADGTDPRLLGLFSGTPMPQKSTEGQPLAIDTVHLFQRNIERAAEGPEHLADEIRITVLHETAHFFGLTEDDLERLGLD